MTGQKRISPSRRRWLDRQREKARQEAERMGTEFEPSNTRWAYSTRSDPPPNTATEPDP